MDKHISSAVKTCFLQLREIRHIQRFIPKSAAVTFANVSVHYRIDYCINRVYGLPKHSLHRLQEVQNSVARIVTRSLSLVRRVLLQFSNLHIGYLLNTVLNFN